MRVAVCTSSVRAPCALCAGERLSWEHKPFGPFGQTSSTDTRVWHRMPCPAPGLSKCSKLRKPRCGHVATAVFEDIPLGMPKTLLFPPFFLLCRWNGTWACKLWQICSLGSINTYFLFRSVFDCLERLEGMKTVVGSGLLPDCDLKADTQTFLLVASSLTSAIMLGLKVGCVLLLWGLRRKLRKHSVSWFFCAAPWRSLRCRASPSRRWRPSGNRWVPPRIFAMWAVAIRGRRRSDCSADRRARDRDDGALERLEGRAGERAGPRRSLRSRR